VSFGFGGGGGGGLALVAATPVAGFPLQNATPTIVTWTTPNDGKQHRVIAFATLSVSVLEVGGNVAMQGFAPDGTAISEQMITGANPAGAYWPNFAYPVIVGPNTVVDVAQSFALTSGVAKVWVELWGE
jgi:hypothetical protein